MGRPINLPRYLSRVPEGLLSAHIVSYAKVLQDRGFRSESAYRCTMLCLGFSRWLKHQNIAMREITREHGPRYLRHRARRIRPCRSDRGALRQFLEFLRDQGVTRKEKVRPLSPVEKCLRAFERYLLEERGLAQITVSDYCTYVGRFLSEHFGNAPAKLNTLCPQDVVEHVQRQTARMQCIQAQHLIGALRSFFRYARYRGAIKTDLCAAIPPVARWSLSSLPRAIPTARVHALLKQCNRNTSVGRRDYAILLLLARLGLRGGEIVRLELEDIDWRAGTLRVHGKGRAGLLPLPMEVGEAIAAYLREGRPSCVSRRVFLTTVAPITGFYRCASIASIVRKALRGAGIKAPHGTHQFRHSLATEMLARSASLFEIGQVLRHQSPNVTRIYAKVDLVALRTLALPWPGVVQ